MAAAITPGKGAALQMSISSAFTDIGLINSISGLDSKPETFDGTVLGGGIGKVKTATGYVEVSDLTIDMFYDWTDTVHKAITTAINSPALQSFKIVIATKEWAFSGYPSLGISIQKNDGVKGTLSIAVSGLVTYPT